MTDLLLLRHGETAYNAEDRFAGRLDVPLNAVGRRQAEQVARQLRDAGLIPDVVVSSPLSRALETAEIVVSTMTLPLRPAVSAALTERHYGALQGRPRSQVRIEFGTEQTERWRRGWNVTPPPTFGPERGAGESLQAVADRVLPYWTAEVVPHLIAGRCVLLVSHGNVLRVLQRELEALTEVEVAVRDLPICIPYRYRWRPATVLAPPVPLAGGNA